MLPGLFYLTGYKMDIAIGLIMIAGGMGFYYLGGAFRKEAQSSLDWPKTDGTVTSSKVVHTVTAGAHGNSNHYQPVVEYSYSTGGKEYSGNNIVIGPTGKLPWLAKREVDQYPVGSSLQVYYNPQDHSEAVLNPGVTKSINGTIAAGLILVGIGIVQLFYPFLHINI
jgi:uncharacterized protein YjeT (DUF2065 family)